jgi:hypothetical protein
MGGGAGTAAIGDALSDAGNLTFRLWQRERESDKNRQIVDATEELNRLSSEVESVADHNQRNTLYESGAEEIGSRFREGLDGPYREAFGLEFDGVAERGRVSIADGVRRASIQTINTNHLSYINHQLHEYGRTTDLDQRAIIKKLIVDNMDAAPEMGTMGKLAIAEQRARAEASMRVEDDLLYEQQTTQEIIDANPDSLSQQLRAARAEGGTMGDKIVTRLRDRDGQDKTIRADLEVAYFKMHHEMMGAEAEGYVGETALRDTLRGTELRPEQVDYLIRAEREKRTGKFTTDYAVVNDLILKIDSGEITHATELNPYLEKITGQYGVLSGLIASRDAAIAGEYEGFLRYAREIIDPAGAHPFEAMAGLLLDDNGNPVQANEGNYYAFVQDFRAELKRRLEGWEGDEASYGGTLGAEARLKVVRDMVKVGTREERAAFKYPEGSWAGNISKYHTDPFDPSSERSGRVPIVVRTELDTNADGSTTITHTSEETGEELIIEVPKEDMWDPNIDSSAEEYERRVMKNREQRAAGVAD